MRILIYNFVQPEAGGGGVGVYSTNLCRALTAAGHDVITMSSGDAYSFFGREPRLEIWDDGHKRASIINSPMIAPARDTWNEYVPYVEDTSLDIFAPKLRSSFGDIDVIHLQNLEGLTASFIRALRGVFPAARMIFSAHNYGSVCPQVELWYQEREHCVDYRDGLNCTMCFSEREPAATIRSARRRRALVRVIDRTAPSGVVVAKKQAVQVLKRLVGQVQPGVLPDADDRSEQSIRIMKGHGDARDYANYRRANIALLADVFDHVLAVSARTRQVLLDRGVKPDNLSVSYIGTAYKEQFLSASRITAIGDRLHIAYLGYMRHSKGFWLFLEALESLPDALAARIAVTVAAKNTDAGAYDRLIRQQPRFAEFRYFDGFTKNNLNNVLDGVNLGIVPPLWEDNLPQVAIELVAHGIPILTSDRGGAQEISNDPRFIFEGGSAEGLAQRISGFADGDPALGTFWTNPILVVSMREHVDDLLNYYAEVPSSALVQPT